MPQAVGAAMEGKDVRFGVSNSATFAAATTLTSTGAVNSFHDSYTALGGMMPMVNMMLGEVAPGGVGAGLYGMLILAVITVFVAGLMVGRTPGVPGQEDRRPGDQVRLAVLPGHPDARADRHGGGVRHRQQLHRAQRRPARPLRGAVRVHLGGQQQRLGVRRHHRQHRRGGTPRSGLAMLLGRFLPIILVLGLAGSLARQKPVPGVGGHAAHPPARCSSAWSSASP